MTFAERRSFAERRALLPSFPQDGNLAFGEYRCFRADVRSQDWKATGGHRQVTGSILWHAHFGLKANQSIKLTLEWHPDEPSMCIATIRPPNDSKLRGAYTRNGKRPRESEVDSSASSTPQPSPPEPAAADFPLSPAPELPLVVCKRNRASSFSLGDQGKIYF